jgi:hypothetical protein
MKIEILLGLVLGFTAALPAFFDLVDDVKMIIQQRQILKEYKNKWHTEN